MADQEMDVEEVVGVGKIVPTSHLPWVEKYRPSSLDDLIAHEDIIKILNQLIDNNKLPHLLFYGPPGTGKTSTIIACAKKMYGEHYGAMTLELNASDDRGIDVVRDQIKEFAGTKKLFSSGVKLIILDEADAMTGDAQAALRRVIEKYTSNTRFCLVCNYVNKIIPALQSRCTRFRFSPLKPDQIRARLQDIVTAEKVHITTEGQEALINLSGGDMRRVLNLLQSAHMSYTHLQGTEAGVGGAEEVIIDEKEVYLTAGAALPGVIHAILTALLNQPYLEAYQFIVKAIDEFGYALTDIVTEVNKTILTRHLPDQGMAYILDKLSNIELRLSHGGNERLQLGALVGAFVCLREMMSG